MTPAQIAMLLADENTDGGGTGKNVGPANPKSPPDKDTLEFPDHQSYWYWKAAK